jgi:outer membrane protein OmpA-like peptidoglycan-associated protein
MSGSFRKFGIGLAAAALVAFAGLGWAYAQEPKGAQQILDALKPKPLTRSLSSGGTSAAPSGLNQEDQRFVNSLRGRRTRSLSAGEREHIAAIVKEKPSIDLTINFDFNSADISRKSVSQVTELGKALSSSELKGGTFLVAGHTDAKGGEEYNQALSERRAQAIKRYLVEKFNIPADNLVTVGYGKTQLKNTADPFGEENRRVQVVNMESSKEARN